MTKLSVTYIVTINKLSYKKDFLSLQLTFNDPVHVLDTFQATLGWVLLVLANNSDFLHLMQVEQSMCYSNRAVRFNILKN